MRNLVYLFELDSVHTAEEEIMIAQQALFEEIVLKGNSVVLSFNQLTDSEAFLCMVRDKSTYENILELFSLGTLKIAPFRPTEDNTKEPLETDIRTASQYMQKAILKNINSKDGSFIFSGLPIKGTETELLKKILRTLQYDDINILLEQMEKEQDKKEKERLEYIVRYIRMILLLSVKENARNPMKTDSKHKFMNFYEKIYSILQEKGINLEKVQAILPDTLCELEKIKMKIPQDKINVRSNWLTEIKANFKLRDGNKEALFLAEAIVNLCYNYTVEDSILNAFKQYKDINGESFKKDFINRLTKYWQLYCDKKHIFCKDESNIVVKHKFKLPKWETAVRTIRDESNMDKYFYKHIKNIKWNTRLLLQLIRRLLVAVIYIVVFCLANLIVGELQGIFDNTLGNLNEMVIAIISTIIFGIISSLLAYFLKLPDILESIKNLGNGIVDYIIIKTSPRNIAYINKDYKENRV